MRLATIALHRLRSLLRPSRADTEMQRELALHIEQLTREYLSAGMSESDAHRAARLEFGSLEAIKEQCRDMRRVTLVHDFFKDLVYACRLLKKSPAFTFTAVLTLALGIGANTAIFSLVNAVLLRTLPAHEPMQLVEVCREGGRALSYAMYEAIRDRNEVFSGVLLTSAGRYGSSLSAGTVNAGEVHFSPVTGDYFTVLGVSPVLGRTLSEADLPPSNAAVISDQLWQRAFARDPAVIGRTIRMARRDYTVVGIAPAGFTGVLTGQSIDVWVPITWFEPGYLRNNVAFMFRIMARRRPGASQEQVRANMTLIARQLSAEWRFERPIRLEVADASNGLTLMRRQFSRPLWILMAAVVLLLLITTVNVANLLLARAGARRREMAVRLSLGASRWRLVRQLLTESVVLGGAGGALGLLAGPVAAASLVRFLSSALGPVDLSLNLDRRILLFTIATSLVVVGLFGLAPALAATRQDLSGMLKGSPSAAARAGRRARPRTLLVVGQVAISCVLLAGAILFARSLRTLTHVDTGFRSDNVLLLSVGLDPATSTSDVQRVRIYDRVLERLSRVPGVQSAALSSERLFGGGTWTEPVSTPAFTPFGGQEREAVLLVISPRFFQTMGTGIQRGRAFDERDDEHAARVAIVNEATARYYFDRTDAVGETFQLGDRSSAPQIRVVGVVRDAKYRNLKEPAPRIIYLPALQEPGPVGAPNLAIRTKGDPEKFSDLLWKEAHSEVADLRWRGVATQAQLVNGTIAQDRMLAQLSGAFSLTAIVLVCLGLYGLTAYEVSRRTGEISVRLALGARPADVVRLFVGRSMMLVTTGVLVGLAGAAVLGRLGESLLFDARSADALTLAASAAMLLVIGAAAAYWPARRAAQLDPIATLRAE
jgi:putative ABC transport system permease protein